MKVRRALISVYDKMGIVDFCKRLEKFDIEILSTGGTATLLEKKGLKIRQVSEYTKFPEMMEGRLKTLHPKIHGGLLGRRGVDDEVMAAHGIEGIDLLVVNLYPFSRQIACPHTSLADAIEMIDIGGPAMLRAAAKNYNAVAAVVTSKDYPALIEELEDSSGCVSEQTCFSLAHKAFAHTANYDATISNFLGSLVEKEDENNYPRTFTMQFHKQAVLRYGENPHQTGAFYREEPISPGTLSDAEQLQGKPLSYNNIADTDVALECALSFDQPACVIVKHANPCGVAVAESLLSAYEKAYLSDSVSAFGGIIAFNRPLNRETAARIVAQQFVEVIIAPEIEEGVIAETSAKQSIRVLACGLRDDVLRSLQLKRVSGGLLIQDADTKQETEFNVVTKREPTKAEYADLRFAWQVVKYVKSNAIVYCQDGQVLGVGAGQMSRVFSTKIAALKAEEHAHQLAGSVVASDGFFPFPDGIDLIAKSGASAVIQPGGSIRDKEVIAVADACHLAMVFTGSRHFLH